MKITLQVIWLFVLYIMALPTIAQSSDLLLYTVAEDTVHLLNVATGEVAQIAQLSGDGYESWKDVGWSPDGRYVWMTDMLVKGQRRLRLYDTIDGEEQTINEGLIPHGCNPSLDWSPNGEYLSFFTGDEINRDLTVMNLANESGDTLSGGISIPVWSPEGQYFIARVQTLRNEHILMRASDGVTLRNFNAYNSQLSPVWSLDERYLIVGIETDKNEHILVRASDGVTLRNFDAYGSHFSPDSDFVAYNDKNKTIWVYELANEEPINLEIRGSVEGWSPNGRYLLIENDTSTVSYSYYDVQTQTLNAIEMDYTQHFVGWMHDNIALIRAYLPDNGGQILFSYDLVSGELQSILETADSFGITRNEDWIVALLYPADDPKSPNPYRPATQIQFISDKTVIEAELTISTYNPFTNSKQIASSPDGEWLALNTAQGLYRFNLQTGVLEQFRLDDIIALGTLHWSADGRYLAFQSRQKEPDAPNYITVWDTSTDTINVWEKARGKITGMQNTSIQNSLLYCGMG